MRDGMGLISKGHRSSKSTVCANKMKARSFKSLELISFILSTYLAVIWHIFSFFLSKSSHLIAQCLSHFLEKNDISYCDSDSITTKQHIFWEMLMHEDHMAVPHNRF